MGARDPDPERFRRVTALFAAAMDHAEDAEGRIAYVKARSDVDDSVQREVLAMLAFHAADDPTTGGDAFEARAVAAVRHETATMGETVYEGVPERVGPYEIVRHVATGGMGTVYEALQAAPLRRVAVKVIRTALQTPRAVRRFEKEGELLAGLKHPGIARVYALGRAEAPSGGLPYIVMEFVDGPAITEHARREALEAPARLALLAQVCDAVAHAHEHGIIHRDLKPSNILVDADGHPKLVDFGIARTYGERGAERSSISLAGQLLGTLSYMSPEQTRGGRHPLDARADVFSIAAVGFELLSGAPPHDLRGASVPEAYAAMTSGPAPRLVDRVPDIDPRISEVLAAALAPDREARTASAAALAAALRACLPADAPPES